MRRTVSLLLVVCIVALLPATTRADERWFGGIKGSRGVTVEEKVRNENPAFVVRVDVDHPGRVYEDQDLMYVNVVSETKGYLYLLYKQADKSELCLFPNRYQRDNLIAAKRKTIVPAANADFNLRMGEPFGKETLIALVTLKPLSADQFGARSLTDKHVTSIDLDTLIAKGVGVELKHKPTQWAEHHVSITTVREKSPPPTKKRLGLFIGISTYKDDRVRDLKVCHRDAAIMAKAMEDVGDLDGGGLLTDKDATLNNIRDAFRELAQKTKAGDEVFIYWSGHGARCADESTDKEEEDGYDEFLVPYDGRTGSLTEVRKSMLLDDTFGRWVQDLDGRRVVIILDACHSGGHSTNMKGFNLEGGYFDFIDAELGRTKDIGQDAAAMLCSSDSHEISAERREGDVSVMTYFLLKRMLGNDDKPVTLRKAYDYVKKEVPAYIKKEFPGREQTPILVNEIGDFCLRR